MNRPFNAWRVGARYYLPLLGAGSLLCGVAVIAGQPVLGAIALAPGLLALNFFRDPPRRIPADREAIVSPADGKVVSVERLEETPHFDGPCRRVAIFLNVFNVHVNRTPAHSGVRRIEYKEGEFKNAMNPESSKVNESNAVWLDTEHGPMTVRQISGAIARRIVCVPGVGETLEKGQKFGMIKFGSRTELYLPLEAEVVVTPGMKVRGGSSVLAKMP